MSATGATAKLSVLVTPATKRALEVEARAKKTTVGELVRQRLTGEPDGDEQAFMEALVDLGKRADVLAVRMDATHAAIEMDHREWPAREAEIRRRTLAGITEAEGVALRAFFSPPTAGAGA